MGEAHVMGEEWLQGSVLSTASWPRHHTLACSPPHLEITDAGENVNIGSCISPSLPLMWLLYSVLRYSVSHPGSLNLNSVSCQVNQERKELRSPLRTTGKNKSCPFLALLWDCKHPKAGTVKQPVQNLPQWGTECDGGLLGLPTA